jgi:hypothetical protein
MLSANPPIACNTVSESHNEETFHGSLVCPMNTKFNHENGCVSQYIFFSLLAVQSLFPKKQVFEHSSHKINKKLM